MRGLKLTKNRHFWSPHARGIPARPSALRAASPPWTCWEDDCLRRSLRSMLLLGRPSGRSTPPWQHYTIGMCSDCQNYERVSHHALCKSCTANHPWHDRGQACLHRDVPVGRCEPRALPSSHVRLDAGGATGGAKLAQPSSQIAESTRIVLSGSSG